VEILNFGFAKFSIQPRYKIIFTGYANFICFVLSLIVKLLIDIPIN